MAEGPVMVRKRARVKGKDGVIVQFLPEKWIAVYL